MKRLSANLTQPPLQPLRLPIGWIVKWNTFYEVEARFKSWDDTSWNFSEDMLLLENRSHGVTIFLGWYPEFRARGTFMLEAERSSKGAKAEGRSRPFRKLKTRSKKKIVATLEDWLQEYAG